MADSSSSSVKKDAWTRKRKLAAKAASMREAKRRIHEGETSSSAVLEAPTVEIVPPAEEEMDQDELISENSDSEASESDEEGVFDQQRAQEIFDDYMLSLPLELRRMLGVILMESFKTRQKMNVKDAAKEAGSIVGFNEKTVRRHRNDFFGNEGKLTLSRQGKYERHCVYHDEDLNRKAREWVRENAFKKGEPNMNAAGFCEFVNNKLLPSSYLPPYFPRLISLRTAIRWLRHLGFKPRSHKKGVYIDGHEREDVVKHRVEYLKVMEELRKTHKPPPQCADEEPRVRVEEDEEKKTLVLLYHDESIYNTNEGQSWMWAEDDHPALLPKTKGSGIMVADFIDEHNGYLQLTPEEHAANPSLPQSARAFLEYGAEREGYWTGERFMAQVKNACDIAEVKYPPSQHTLVFIFDQSSCHTKYDDQALLAKNILVKDGGPRRVRDTVWAGNVQEMVLPDGRAKGLRTVLTERGINPQRMKADDMRIVLSQHDDFRNEKAAVQQYVEGRGHKSYFLPKFHCEMNPIERVWGQSKRYCRAYTNFTLVKLRQILNPALESVSTELIRKYFRKARDYEKAYSEGLKAGREVEEAVKKYKSHRRVFSETF